MELLARLFGQPGYQTFRQSLARLAIRTRLRIGGIRGRRRPAPLRRQERQQLGHRRATCAVGAEFLSQEHPHRYQRREQTIAAANPLLLHRPLHDLRRQKLAQSRSGVLDQTRRRSTQLAPQPSLATMAFHKASLPDKVATPSSSHVRPSLSIRSVYRRLRLREVPFVAGTFDRPENIDNIK